MLQIKTYWLTIPLNLGFTFLCKEQNHTTTLSLGQITPQVANVVCIGE